MFTDDDLKRLKAHQYELFGFCTELIKALIARLEADELALKHLEVHDCPNCRRALEDAGKAARNGRLGTPPERRRRGLPKKKLNCGQVRPPPLVKESPTASGKWSQRNE